VGLLLLPQRERKCPFLWAGGIVSVHTLVGGPLMVYDGSGSKLFAAVGVRYV
jgi:hypothetical protein